MNPQSEILDPAITSRSVAQPMIRQAVKHFREARRATIQVMADLRTLQNAQVQVLYGYRSFAQWAEDTFEGLRVGNVNQLTRAGAIALKLDERKLIDLEKPEGIGTTALRELSVISKHYGDEKMIEAFITARDMLEEGKEVSDTTIKAAMQLLMPPAETDLLQLSPNQVVEIIDEEEDSDGLPEKVKELIDRIQDLAWDLPETTEELELATIQLKAEISNADTIEDQEWIEASR